MAKRTTKIIVAGACGRMGKTILSLAYRDPNIQIAGAVEEAHHPFIGRDVGEMIGAETLRVPVHPDLRECIDRGNVVIDFTHPKAVPQNLQVALKAKRAMVIGTTGLDQAFLNQLRAVSKTIPIVQSPNMSVGVN